MFLPNHWNWYPGCCEQPVLASELPPCCGRPLVGQGMLEVEFQGQESGMLEG